MNDFARQLLDTKPGFILAAVFLVVIGGFVVFAHPFTQPSTVTKSKPTPTKSVATTINGKASFKCSHPNCPTDFSAYDVVAYPSNSTSEPIAQGPIAKDGTFTLYLPTGTYYLKTLPTTSSPTIKILVTAHTPPITLTVSP